MQKEGEFSLIKTDCITSADQTRQDTFVSCTENSQSLNELELLFDQSCVVYELSSSAKKWINLGKCNLQIIEDEISTKKKYQAHIICTLVSDRKTHQFNISRASCLIGLKNSETACCWYEPEQKVNQLEQNAFMFGSAAVKFENIETLAEFKQLFMECQSKMGKMEFSLVKNAWQPPDFLPDEPVNVNLMNEASVKFERQITLKLNNLFNYSGVPLKLFDSSEISSKKIYVILVEMNKNVYFKHYIIRDQKFETRYVDGCLFFFCFDFFV